MNSNLQKIDHVVVLMLENRSFDNMLGWLGASDGGKQKVNGVAGKDLSNPIPSYAMRPRGIHNVRVNYEWKTTNPNPDPGEDYIHVNTQLFGRVIPKGNRYKPFDQPPYNLRKHISPSEAPMNGFVKDYINCFNAIRGRMPTYDEYKIVMGCHPETAVPVITTLAKEYAVFDAWFSSVPSQTLCNRSFMHAATSHGYVLNSPFYHWLLHDSMTIFNQIDAKGDPSITWKIYFDELDIVSLAGLQNPKLWKDRNSNFKHMDDFEADAIAGKLPSYSFIEPRFFMDHNDQHPPVGQQILETSSVLAGEQLMYDVYQILRKSKKWENTLLIITFDEHGGCYDHVPPPATVPPDPQSSNHQMDFQFDRLGVRVPTVMVSPLIKKGTVISEVHDHTSILKMIETRWDLEPLTERDKHANDISKVLNLKSPRQDSPEIKPHPYHISEHARDEPINDLQKGMLFIMAGFEDTRQIEHDKNIFEKAEELFQLVVDEGRIVHIKTVGQAINFTMDFDRRTSKRLSFWKWLWLKMKRIFE